jgi:Zn-dependent peptidase ImmA (M78 family)
VFRHGFKSWCERIALEKRAELGLQPLDRLDPNDLAKQLGVVVRFPKDVPGLSSGCLKRLLEDDPDGWSAVSLRQGSRTIIIMNSAHSKARQASDLMHELAHLLLAHTPARVDVTKDMQLLLRTHDRGQEDEANWLAGCLLLPRPIVMTVHRKRQAATAAAHEYGVSVDMVNYRLRVTGVGIQEQRLQARRSR